jgi:hypothetical protein
MVRGAGRTGQGFVDTGQAEGPGNYGTAGDITCDKIHQMPQ